MNCEKNFRGELHLPDYGSSEASNPMKKALFLNGVYESVLEEILKAQGTNPEIICFLQPYKAQVIRALDEHQPAENNPLTLYISLTSSLHLVSYIATIVGWEDKRKLFEDKNRLEELNKHIKRFQPGEREISAYSDAAQTKPCLNLIAVKNVKRLTNPFSVSNLIKDSDKKPYKPRTQSGGWSKVNEVPEWIALSESTFRDVLDSELEEKVRSSKQGTGKERLERLSEASTKPREIQVISRGFARNPDVIVEVLLRANGVCERCKKDAPFLRKKDNTPYLEVHHKVQLANGGHDTVKNAIALCPNCHREAHFGV
jgi:predicted HNH restriction endonuclease